MDERDILIISFNHKKCPVEIREKVNVSDEDLQSFYGRLPFPEKAALLTCNRREIIVKTGGSVSAAKRLKAFLADNFRLSPRSIAGYSQAYRGTLALRHLFETAAGLRSAVIGETQILGQVKDAYLKAKHLGAVGKCLDRVFQRTLYAGRLARSRTGISKGGVSAAKEAVKMAGEQGGLKDKAVLIIGTGKINSLAARYLLKHGPKQVHVVNRTFEKARGLARELGLRPAGFEKLNALLREADVVFSATSAKGFIVDRKNEAGALSDRNTPVLIIDLAAPRDFDPSLAGPKVKILNIDDVKTRIRKNMKRLRGEVKKAKKILAGELRNFTAGRPERKSPGRRRPEKTLP